MPRNAELICKLSGLLLQACWYQLKAKARGQEIPAAMDEMLNHLWQGRVRYTEGLALSLLQEASLAPAHSIFRTLVTGPEIYVRWRKLLNRSQRYKEFKNELREAGENIYQLFSELLNSLPLLRLSSLDKQRFRLPLGEVGIFPYIYYHPNRIHPLFLSEFDTSGETPVVVFEDPFGDYIEDFSLVPELPEFEQYRLMRQVLRLETAKPGILYLFGPGYEHMTNLVRAIVEKTQRDYLLWVMNQLDRDMGNSTQGVPIEDVVTQLLIKKGPKEVLEKIFVHNMDTALFESYLAFFQHRGELSEKNANDLRDRYKKEFTRKKKSVDVYLDLDEELKKEIEVRLDVDTRASCILRAAGMEKEVQPGHEYVESIGLRIRMLETFLQEFQNRRADVISTGVKIGKLTERTFRFLIAFYEGLVAYHETLREGGMDYIKAEERMIARARDLNRSLRLSGGHLINEFIMLINRLRKHDALNSLLGRSEVCKKSLFTDLASNDWIGILNRLKHDVPDPVNSAELEWYIERALQLFEFLRDGAKVPGRLPVDERQPVYPHVVTFREEYHKRGGLVVYSYAVASIDGRKKDWEISVLTGRQDLGAEQYYCIPKTRRIVGYWVDPLLIPARAFDEALRESELNQEHTDLTT
jgi:hypothetical protein